MLLILCSGLLLGAFAANGDQKEPGEVLIGNELRDIAMDADYVWIATEKGVNRYDRGADEWKFYTVADGLVSNKVNCIAPERVEGLLTTKTGNEIWFGTDSGVSVYDKMADSWRSYTEKDGLIYNRVNAISARGSDVWIATNKGVSVYNRKKDTWMSYSKFPGIPTSEVTAVYHQAVYAWIGTQQGLARYNYRYRKWEHFSNRVGSRWFSPGGGPRKTDDSPLPDDRINSIDGEGRYVYIATKSALVEYNRNAASDFIAERTAYSALGRARRTSRNALYRSRLMRPGDLLQMSRSRQESWVKMGWRHMKISGLMRSKQYEVTDNFLDVKYRSGQAWVATSRGLVRFDSWVGERQLFTKDNGLIDNQVNTIATVGGEVWVGTAHGLGRYNTYTRTWKNYRMERALPSSFVMSLAEDKGAMWFGTRGAASSFNQQSGRWKTFTRDQGLAGANVNSIAVVGNYVWFGTDEGVSRLNKTTKEWNNFNANNTGLVSNDVAAILVDGKYIWVGTKSGLSRYDDTTGEWETYSTSSGLLDNYINALAADPKFVWIGTRAGLNGYDKATEEWTSYTTPDGLKSDVITSLVPDRDRVWIATKGGLYSLDRKTGEFTSHTDKPINTITLEDRDKIWMGGRGSISLYELATDRIQVFSDADVEGLSRVNVYGAQNTAQYVWFATDGGIFRYNKADHTWWIYSPTKTRGSTDTLVAGNVQAIAGDEDFIYFGTVAGISRYDRMTDNWISYTVEDGLIDPNVHALLLDGPDLWVGTQNGISQYDTVSDTWTDHTREAGLPSKTVFSLALDKNGRIWAGTRRGAAFLEKGKSKWQMITKDDGLPDDHVWWVAVDDPYIWFGTNGGAARYSPADDLWLIYRVDDGLMNDVVLSIGFEDKYIFFNTPSGTSIYDRTLDSFTPFSQADGLAGSTAKCIGSTLPSARRAKADQSASANQLRQQEIWIGTYGGVTRYDLVTDTSENITVDDGLAGNKVQVIKADGEYIWFGTDSGLSRYNPMEDEWITYGKAAISQREEQSSGLTSYNIKSLAVDDIHLWVGTRAGLSRYDKVNDTWRFFPLIPVRPDSVSTPTLTSGLVDGLLPQQEQQSLLGRRSQQPPTDRPSIRAIAVGGNQLWLGSRIGLFIYDKALDELPWYTSDVLNIRDIRIHDGKIWMISDDQIVAFERGESFDSWTSYTDHRVVEEVTSDTGHYNSKSKDLDKGLGVTRLTSAIVDGDLVWLGRERGLRMFDTRKLEPVTSIHLPEDISEKKITAIDSDEQYFWIGTRSGLYRRDRKTGTWKLFTDDDGLVSNYVSCLAVDNAHIWVGSSDRGASKYDKTTSKWTQYTSADGLSDNNVRAIAVDEKYIWFGTFSGGVCRYDKTSKLWTTYRTAEYTGRSQR